MKKAKESTRLINLILTTLQYEGKIILNQDKKGRYTGIILNLSGKIGAKSNLKPANLEIVEKKNG